MAKIKKEKVIEEPKYISAEAEIPSVPTPAPTPKYPEGYDPDLPDNKQRNFR